jgi:hypothetical protein
MSTRESTRITQKSAPIPTTPVDPIQQLAINILDSRPSEGVKIIAALTDSDLMAMHGLYQTMCVVVSAEAGARGFCVGCGEPIDSEPVAEEAPVYVN